MSFVVSLVGYRPIPRFDGIAWSAARIEESPSNEGPWAELETQALVPQDADPEEPQIRNLTADSATLEQGWYRVVFLDSAGNENVADPTFTSTVLSTPSATDVRRRSKLIQRLYPVEPPDAEADEELVELVADAVALVQSLTCRTIDASLDSDLLRIAYRAVTLKSEALAVGADAKRRQRTVASGNLRSFTAGRYSESYFGPEEAAKAKRLDPDPALHEALWALATEECREAWLALWSGQPAAASVINTFAYGPRGAIGSY